MHRVIQVQSLKFLEQRQRQSTSFNSASAQPTSAAHDAAATNASLTAAAAAVASPFSGLPSDDLLSPSSTLLPEGANGSSTVISIKDFSSSADERSAAALDTALSHEKTITIIYHTDKKDSKQDHSAASAGNAKANTSSSAAGSQAALNTAAASKLQSTILIDEVVRRRREKLKRSPRGVWSSLGSPYQMKGDVDVEVGSIGRGSGGIREMTRRKPRGGGAGGRAAQGREAGGEATRKVERLIELFRQSRVKMLQTSHDAIREREREREREKEREIQRRENKSRQQQLTDAAGGDPLTAAADGSIGASGLGSGDSLQQQQQQHAPPLLHMASSSSVVSTAREAGSDSAGSGSSGGRAQRLEYIARWRQLFDETKQAMDRQLIKRLVERAESRARRIREGVSMEAVERIISGAGRKGRGRGGGKGRQRAAVQHHSEAAMAEAEEKTSIHALSSR